MTRQIEPALTEVERLREQLHLQELELARLQRSSELQSRLIAGVLHDLRSPLNVMMVATQVVCDETIRAERRQRNARLLVDAAETINALCQDTLDYSKLSSGEMQIHEKPFDLSECLYNVCDGLRLLAQKKGIELRLNLSSDFPQWVVGDPQRIRQILVNLISNALKFTLQGHVELSACLLELAEPGERLRLGFTVSDTGLGIHSEKLGELFGAYRQAHDELSTELGGAGLGLAIASRLVQCMGGHLTATSQAGRGTSFRLDILVGACEQEHSAQSRSPLKGKRILILDEVPESREELESVCLQLEMHPVVVSDGISAVRLLEEAVEKGCSFPLALINLDSGGGDALFVVEQIHPERRRTTRFLAYALQGQQADLALCQEAELQGYLSGPLQPENLARMLREVIQRPTLERPLTLEECASHEEE